MGVDIARLLNADKPLGEGGVAVWDRAMAK
jgi:hypothetical protein